MALPQLFASEKAKRLGNTSKPTLQVFCLGIALMQLHIQVQELMWASNHADLTYDLQPGVLLGSCWETASMKSQNHSMIGL